MNSIQGSHARRCLPSISKAKFIAPSGDPGGSKVYGAQAFIIRYEAIIGPLPSFVRWSFFGLYKLIRKGGKNEQKMSKKHQHLQRPAQKMRSASIVFPIFQPKNAQDVENRTPAPTVQQEQTHTHTHTHTHPNRPRGGMIDE